jgi:hypothetical protein
MQRLRGRGWVKAIEVASAPTVVAHLLERRWIESEGTGRQMTFRLTDDGLAAKKAVVPIRRRARH